jgi:putative ABC transport system permease protein
MLKDYFRLAYQGASHRKLRSWLTMIGIFIGIAAVVALMSLSQGLQTAIGEQFVSLGSDKIIVQAVGSGFGPPGTGAEIPLTIKDQEVIEKTSGIDMAIGRLVRSVQLEFKEEAKYAYAASMPEDDDEMDLAIEANNYKIDQGRLLKKGDKFKIMIGADFADDFFDQSLQLRDKINIEDQKFKVIGILKKSGNPQQDGTLVVPEGALREVFGIEEEYDIIPAKVSAGEDVAAVTERVKKELRKSRDVEEGKEDFTVETPESLLSTLNSIMAIVQGVLVGIAAISLLVGGIGIMNTMYTAVVQRTREIGIMKALGARRESILLLFLIESGFLGLFGGLIGVTIGFTISKSVEIIAFQIYGSYLIKADFNLSLMVGMLLFGFFIGMVSGWFPARQAAKLNPVDALRK